MNIARRHRHEKAWDRVPGYQLTDEGAVGPLEGREALIVYGSIAVGSCAVVVLVALHLFRAWLS